MDTFLAIASKRDERAYADREVPDEIVLRILDAGRLSGSSRNTQKWRFVVVEDPGARERLANAVYAPDNVRGAALVVAIVGSGFDLGRAAQNMMLAAWNEGVTSCPNGIADAEGAARELGLGPDERAVVILSFGYPERPRDPESRPAEEWSRRAKRKRLEEVARRL